MRLSDFNNSKDRRDAVSSEMSIDLSALENVKIEEDISHCENLIGAVSIPVGVAGPIKINGKIKRDAYVPIATTEGALVASISRGCKVVTLSGGADYQIEVVGATRGPVFETDGVLASQNLAKFIHKNFEELAAIAEKTSNHLVLRDIQTQINGPFVYVRFIYDTDEAMGMNMVTIATEKIVSSIEIKTGANCVAVAGNYDVDKKPSWLNFLTGRGRKLHADCRLPADIVKKHLKVNVSDFVKTTIVKCWGGSIVSGSMGYNAHFANIVAGFFAATGQDLAHVVEGSIGITFAKELEDGSLYVSVMLPDVMIGTVGGGTKLSPQKQAVAITGAKNTNELAGVLACAVLAGEISLIASLTEKTLACSHQKLGR